MEKPKTFWVIAYENREPVDSTLYLKKEDALMSAAGYASEERCVIHVYQCSPTMTYNPVMEEKSW